jgi:hypothetical protein
MLPRLAADNAPATPTHGADQTAQSQAQAVASFSAILNQACPAGAAPTAAQGLEVSTAGTFFAVSRLCCMQPSFDKTVVTRWRLVLKNISIHHIRNDNRRCRSCSRWQQRPARPQQQLSQQPQRRHHRLLPLRRSPRLPSSTQPRQRTAARRISCACCCSSCCQAQQQGVTPAPAVAAGPARSSCRWRRCSRTGRPLHLPSQHLRQSPQRQPTGSRRSCSS